MAEVGSGDRRSPRGQVLRGAMTVGNHLFGEGERLVKVSAERVRLDGLAPIAQTVERLHGKEKV